MTALVGLYFINHTQDMDEGEYVLCTSELVLHVTYKFVELSQLLSWKSWF